MRAPEPPGDSVSSTSLADRYYEAFNARDLDAWLDTLDEEVEIVNDGGVLRGRTAARAHLAITGWTAMLMEGVGGIEGDPAADIASAPFAGRVPGCGVGGGRRRCAEGARRATGEQRRVIPFPHVVHSGAGEVEVMGRLAVGSGFHTRTDRNRIP